MTEKISPKEARQGRWGRPVLVVLVVALLLAMIAWLGAEWYGEEIDANAPADPGRATSTDSQNGG